MTVSIETAIDGQVRLATEEERKLVYLKLTQAKPPEDASDWDERQILVIEHGGAISGYIGARLIWQIEGVYLFPEFVRDSPPVTLRRAVFKLIRGMEQWLRNCGARWYFCVITRKDTQKNAVEYGMRRIYKKSKIFGRDL